MIQIKILKEIFGKVLVYSYQNMKIILTITILLTCFYSIAQNKIIAKSETVNYTLAQAEIKIGFDISSEFEGKKIVVKNITDNEELTSGLVKRGRFFLNGKITFPEKWQPYNWDKTQKTYELLVEIKQGGKLLESYKFVHGFIDKELVEEIDALGVAYYFKINGRKCFVKGIDLRSIESISVKDFENETIKQVKQMGFNLIRMPKLSLEKLDSMYTICDKNGIMVWQDLTENYFEISDFSSIGKETKRYLDVLAQHPCMIALCGYKKGYFETLLAKNPQESNTVKKVKKSVFETLGADFYVFEVYYKIPYILQDIEEITFDTKGRKELKSIREPSGRFNFIREGNHNSLKFIEYSRKSKPKTFGYIIEFIDVYSNFEDYTKANQNYLIIPEVHENDIVFFVVNDSLKSLNAQIRVEAFTTKGEKINQKDAPVKLSNQLCNFGADIKKDFLKEKTKEDSYLVVSILDKGKVLSTRKVYWKNE